jgi:hypothetical protein
LRNASDEPSAIARNERSLESDIVCGTTVTGVFSYFFDISESVGLGCALLV